MKPHIIAFTILCLLIASPFLAVGETNQDTMRTPEQTENLSNGWTHRPLVEHFTGLSCPPCMNGAHPDLTRLWQEEGYTEEQTWNYIEWHEYNGGGEDALATEDSYDRMKLYQPGVSGTPNADVDGGYVECGGSHQSNGCDYETVKQALEDSGTRDDSEMKMVDLEVYNSFDADTNTFSISGKATYLSTTGGIFDSPALNGKLYIFMVEDHVTAWSKTLDAYADCHNVFREYAIEDEAFTLLQAGADEASVYEFSVDWEIPTTMVARDENDDWVTMDIQVPINPMNVYPIAVVFDDDDRSSGTADRNKDGDDGRGTPRLLQSATPKTTAYDQGNAKPEIDLPIPEMDGDDFVVLAGISDDSGDADNAYLVWRNTQEKNDTGIAWEIVTMEQAGSFWKGSIAVNESSKITYGVMTFDAQGAMSVSEEQQYPTITAEKEEKEDEFPLMTAVGISGLLALVLVGGFVLSRKGNKEEEEVEDEEYGDEDL